MHANMCTTRVNTQTHTWQLILASMKGHSWQGPQDAACSHRTQGKGPESHCGLSFTWTIWATEGSHKTDALKRDPTYSSCGFFTGHCDDRVQPSQATGITRKSLPALLTPEALKKLMTEWVIECFYHHDYPASSLPSSTWPSLFNSSPTPCDISISSQSFSKLIPIKQTLLQWSLKGYCDN